MVYIQFSDDVVDLVLEILFLSAIDGGRMHLAVYVRQEMPRLVFVVANMADRVMSGRLRDWKLAL